MTMNAADIAEYGGRSSQDDEMARSASLSDDSRTQLLEKRHRSEDHWHDAEKAEPQRTCFIDKWWKLVLLLVVCTALLPVIVNFSLDIKHSHAGNAEVEHGSRRDWIRSPDDYVLSQNWDLEAPTQTRDYAWTISDAEINPDGVFRPMMLINGKFPGPMVQLNEGDTLRVVVINNATNATSIHWHGMYQNGTNHMDGTVGVTQCPIAPGQSLTYEFKVEGQSGTYWYHGHFGAQASDGLFGPLIVHAREEKLMQKIEYETDRVIMLSDHYYDVSGALMRQYLAPDQENAEPIPDAALINGRGHQDCSKVPDRKCDNSTAEFDPPAVSLQPDSHHRLRIINTGAFAEFQFQVDEHELSITEIDGTDVQPKSYHRLNINPAQRYSAVIHTSKTSRSSFWMRARMITTCFAEPKPQLDPDVNVVMRYESDQLDADHETPISKDWGEALDLECRDMNTTELVPVQEVPAPDKADAFYYIRSNFEIGAHRLSRGFFNTSSFRPDLRSPSLHRTLEGLSTSNVNFTYDAMNENGGPQSFINSRAFSVSDELVVQTSGVQTIDLLIHNFDDGNHPMHLHGYKYFVLASGHGSPPRLDPFREPDRANIQPLYDSLDFSNPLRRDTASVEAYGWILLRFVADNPGLWSFHCHINWHAEAGLLMQFATRTDVMLGKDIPQSHKDLCLAKGLDKGRGPSDDDYYASDTG